MSEEIHNKTVGELSERVLALEKKVSNRWEHYFNHKPGVVIGTVIVVLCGAFWSYHVWYIGRLDTVHEQEISKVQKSYEDRLEWLREQNQSDLVTVADKCELDKARLISQMEACHEN